MGEHKRDRSGEPFQDDFTENQGVHPPDRDAASADLNLDPSQVDTEEDDATNAAFARELKNTQINKPVTDA